MALPLPQVQRAAALAGLDPDEGALAALAEELHALIAELRPLHDVAAGDALPAGHDAPPACPAPVASQATAPQRLSADPSAWAPAWRDGMFVVPLLDWAGAGPGTDSGEGAEQA